MNECRDYMELINRGLDNELTEDEGKLLKAHLESCPECKRFQSEMIEMLDALKSEELMEEFPAELSQRVHNALLETVKEDNAATNKAEGQDNKEKSKPGFFTKIFEGSIFSRFIIVGAMAAVMMIAVNMGGETGILNGFDKFNISDMGMKAAMDDTNSGDNLQRNSDMAPVADAENFAGNGAPETNGEPMYKTANIQVQSKSKIIKNANIGVKVTDVRGSVEGIKVIANKYGAFIDEENVYSYEENNSTRNSGDMTVRVPAEKLDGFLAEIKGSYEVTSMNITSQNVTKAYDDMEATLKNLKSRQEALRKLMSKANNMQDILNIDRELNSVKTQIDSLTSEKSYYDDEIKYSTVNISVMEGSPQKTVTDNVLKGIKDSLKLALNVFLKSLYLIAFLLPYLLVSFVIYIIFRKIYKQVGKK